MCIDILPHIWYTIGNSNEDHPKNGAGDLVTKDRPPEREGGTERKHIKPGAEPTTNGGRKTT